MYNNVDSNNDIKKTCFIPEVFPQTHLPLRLQEELLPWKNGSVAIFAALPRDKEANSTRESLKKEGESVSYSVPSYLDKLL